MNTFLRDQREHRALSAEDVARRLDVHPMSVLRWERRERLPGPLHVKALASTLDLETSMVAGFFDEARPSAQPPEALRGHGLRVLRQAAGVPVRRVSRRLGVLPSTVYNWEAGRAMLPLEHLPGLAEVLGIEVPALRQHLADAPASRRERPASELRRLRRRTGLPQAAVAQRVGTTRHRLGAWERGEQPPLWAVRRLAAIYGVPVSRVARAAGVSAPPLLDVRRWSPGDLPQALLALRQWTGLTQGALAEHCGCHASTVRGWEQGRARPLPGTRLRLERLYGLAEGALLAAYPGER